jgi:hypothetical protein
VYLYVGAARRFLGTAHGHLVTEFKIPWRRLAGASRMALIAAQIPSGGSRRRGVSSGLIRPEAGGLIVWTLQPNLAFSTVAVY